MRTKTNNRLKAMCTEKQATTNGFAKKMNLSTTTLLRWCTNKAQPSLETLVKIARILRVDVRELIVNTKK